jgi:hypothetical protein
MTIDNSAVLFSGRHSFSDGARFPDGAGRDAKPPALESRRETAWRHVTRRPGVTSRDGLASRRATARRPAARWSGARSRDGMASRHETAWRPVARRPGAQSRDRLARGHETAWRPVTRRLGAPSEAAGSVHSNGSLADSRAFFTLTGIVRLLSLRGASRRSNLPPDEPPAARQAGDCFVAALLAMTVVFAASSVRVKSL